VKISYSVVSVTLPNSSRVFVMREAGATADVLCIGRSTRPRNFQSDADARREIDNQVRADVAASTRIGLAATVQRSGSTDNNVPIVTVTIAEVT
jgi:hypothetical protein